MSPNRMDEDFFQRVKDVNWESEPEVYWMASHGSPYFLNGQIVGSTDIGLFTSEDGKHWGGGSISGPDGYSGMYDGGWMREGLVKEGKPVWVLVGTRSSGVVQAASTYSTDGRNISDRTLHDKRHYMEKFRQQGPGLVAVSSVDAFLRAHTDTHTSPNGRIWDPVRFHADDYGSTLLAPSQAIVSSPTPFTGDFGPAQKSRDKVLIQGRTHTTAGKLRKGPWLGKTVTMTIKPFDSEAPAHGFSTLEVTDSKTGQILGVTNCGVGRSITVAYGHYVFCVGGALEAEGGRGVIASTDNGRDWVSTALGDNQINVLAVGPRT